MKGGSQPHGFTIVETMIFIAVSGVLFLGALQLISGKQNKTEFATTINTIRSDLQNTLGNVANGYFQTQPNLKCTPTAAGPTFSSGVTNSLGQNAGCVFLGSIIQFGVVSGSNEVYNNIPVAGLQYQYSGGSPTTNLTTNLAQAVPTIINGSSEVTSTTLQYGIKLDTTKGVCYNPTTSTTCPAVDKINTSAFGLFAFNGCTGVTAGTSNLNNGAQCVYIIPLPSLLYAGGALNITDNCGAASNVVCRRGSILPTLPENPQGGIQICLDSGSTNESALFTVGGANNPTGVSMQKYSQTGCL